LQGLPLWQLVLLQLVLLRLVLLRLVLLRLRLVLVRPPHRRIHRQKQTTQLRRLRQITQSL
jgi:hypothetical protein